MNVRYDPLEGGWEFLLEFELIWRWKLGCFMDLRDMGMNQRWFFFFPVSKYDVRGDQMVVWD